MASRINVLPRPLRDDQWTKEELIKRLKIGMQVELSTIPLYLYAYYSINVEASIPSDKRVAGANARFSILGVVQQEMLHLTLLGNLLRAVDAVPILYMDNFIPTYPDTLLSSNVPMSLTRAGRESFENFLKIEAPYYPAPPSTPPLGVSVRNPLPNDPSIGEFYANLVQGIKALREQNLFATPHIDQQFGSRIFNNGDIQIKDEDTALKALELITEQGEGGISVPESHYTVFVDLYNRPQSWVCYDVIKDPKSARYPTGAVKELALAFNASYCYLLLTIQEVWRVAGTEMEHRKHLIKNVHSIMMVIISPLATLLVQQRTTYGGEEKNAGPCFEYFPAPTGTGTNLDRLHGAIKAKLNAAKTSAPNLKDAIDRLLYSVNEVKPFTPRIFL